MVDLACVDLPDGLQREIEGCGRVGPQHGRASDDAGVDSGTGKRGIVLRSPVPEGALSSRLGRAVSHGSEEGLAGDCLAGCVPVFLRVEMGGRLFPFVDDSGDAAREDERGELASCVRLGGVQNGEVAGDGWDEELVDSFQGEVDGGCDMDDRVDAADGGVEGAGEGDVRDDDMLVLSVIGVEGAVVWVEKALGGGCRARCSSDGVATFEELDGYVAGDIAVDARDEDDFVGIGRVHCVIVPGLLTRFFL